MSGTAPRDWFSRPVTFTGTNKGRGSTFTPPKTPPAVPHNLQMSADEYLRRLEQKPGVMDNLGTTSRAYANAQGSQSDLNVPNSSRATQSQGTSSMPVGGSGSGGTGGSAIDPLTALGLSPTDLNPIYDELIKKVTGYGTQNDQAVEDSKKFIGGIYDKSSADMYKDYMNSQGDLQASIKGLGGGSTGNYDGVLRGIEENSNLAENSDLAYLEKMKGARNVQIKDLMASVERDRQNQLLTQQQQIVDLIASRSSGGSGGSGGKSGGSSGGKTTGSTTATQTDIVNDPQANAIYQYLAATDPAVAAAFHENYDATMGNDMTKSLTSQIGNASKNVLSDSKITKAKAKVKNLPKTGANWLTLPSKIVNRSAVLNQKQKDAIAVLKRTRDASYGIGGWNNPSSTQKVTSTAKQT